MLSNKKELLIKWLKQESEEAKNAETFSRNGESTEFDDGMFKGREEATMEVAKIIEGGCNFKSVHGVVILK